MTGASFHKGAALLRGGFMAILMAAASVGISAPSLLHAQSTSGSIVGHAPAGTTIEVKGPAGTDRKTTVKDNGRYAIHSLPVGVYTVKLYKNGEEYDSRYNIGLRVGAAFKVDFPCENDHCAKD